MSKPSQVRNLYQILRLYVDPSCKDFELLKRAAEIIEINDESFTDGYEFLTSYEYGKTIDAYEAMSSSENDRLFQERHLLNCMFDDELDNFTNTQWRKSVHKEIYGYY